MAIKNLKSTEVVVDLEPPTAPREMPAFVVIVTTKTNRRAYLTLAAAGAARAAAWQRGDVAQITLCALCEIGGIE